MTHAVQLLSEEIDRNMALLGVSSLDDLNTQFLRQVRPV
ncbi:alpha-hydroxy-acid oxidizing protein [Agrobacterium sp. lyk4-40-TYG-31]|nr:alpha-hydroxy-acid oxidizing protein [Agrobacterium sp. lyk4-40-TYG-31]